MGEGCKRRKSIANTSQKKFLLDSTGQTKYLAQLRRSRLCACLQRRRQMADKPPRQTKSTLGLSGLDSRESGTGTLFDEPLMQHSTQGGA
jgi:hypothetical protein